MFQNKEIDYIQIKQGQGNNLFGENFSGESLFIKYINEPEQFLTNKKVDLKDFKIKQKEFIKVSEKRRNKLARTWKERYDNYLKFKGLYLKLIEVKNLLCLLPPSRD